MKILPTPVALCAAVALAVTLAACGSNAPATVTVTRSATSNSSSSSSSAAPSSSSSSSTSTTSTGAATSSATSSSAASSTSASTSSATTSTTTTRTQTGPAFVGPNPSSGAAVGRDLAAAIAVLARTGYVPLRTSTYDADDTLRVLIGRLPGSSQERAFFFDQTIYLGTDASTPSEQISLVSQNDTEATLAYGIYRPGASSPSGQQRVRFALDMGQLSPLDALPSAAARR